jgi:uncharacterized protein YdcH (DUF465 family)
MEYPNPQRVPMVSPITGMVTREWLIFFERRLGIAGTNTIIEQIVQAADTSPISMPYSEVSSRLETLDKDIQSLPITQISAEIQNILALISELQQSNNGYILQEIDALKVKIAEIEQSTESGLVQDIQDLKRSISDLQQGVFP